MNMLLGWAAAGFSTIYGMLNAYAGLSQMRIKKIQAWAALGLIVFGAAVAAGGVLALLKMGSALIVLIAGLAGIHLLAIHNGLKLHGGVNLSHHLVRLLISATLIALTYFSLR